MAELSKLINKSEYERNIAHIRQLFPHCVVETTDTDGAVIEKVDLSLLGVELGIKLDKDTRERFVLSWPGKKQSVENANSAPISTLLPVRDMSVNFDQTQNIFVEGENLEVLKILQESYLGKVKLVYLDPPYNTGNDSFMSTNVQTLLQHFSRNLAKFRLMVTV